MLTLSQVSLAQFYNPALKQDQAFLAIAKALDPALQNFVSQISRGIIWPALSNQPEEVIDFLAVYDRNVDYYDANLPYDKKVALLENVILDKSTKGTPSRVKNLLSTVFNYAEVVEWWQDAPGTRANTFRIVIADPLVDEAKVAGMIRAILLVKNVRSYFAGLSSLITAQEPPVYVAVGAGQYNYEIIGFSNGAP